MWWTLKSQSSHQIKYCSLNIHVHVENAKFSLIHRLDRLKKTTKNYLLNKEEKLGGGGGEERTQIDSIYNDQWHCGEAGLTP